MCRYKISYALITDNERHFDNNNFREFCKNIGIELKFYSLVHLQANGQWKLRTKP